MNHALQSLRCCVAAVFLQLVPILLLTESPAQAASLQKIQNFGNNPSNIAMYLYVPAKPASPAPVVVALHYCSGNAQAYFSGLAAGLVTLADQHGYIVIFPQTTAYGSCWDVFSKPSLTHNGGSDSVGIISMVNHVIASYGGDADRVYAVGSSSGAMMTNVLLGAYPDVFKAGAAFSGVPFGCWIGADPSSGWNSACANGQVKKTAQQWGELVRGAYPGFAGGRPRMQLWHGDADQLINFANFGEAIKGWTDVYALSPMPTTTEKNTPQANFTRTRYEDACGNVRLEAVQEGGQPHLINVNATEVVRFFGLDVKGPDPGAEGCGGSTSSSGGGPTSSSSGSAAGTSGSSSGGVTGGAGGTTGASGGESAASGGAGGATGGGGAAAGTDGTESAAGCACRSGAGGERGGALVTMILIGAVLCRRGRKLRSPSERTRAGSVATMARRTSDCSAKSHSIY